ncbi:MAG TPA: HD domain-containing protein [Firmicutes bacterium]|nr:HD domain-containing protein [Bacillota bacterium]
MGATIDIDKLDREPNNEKRAQDTTSASCKTPERLCVVDLRVGQVVRGPFMAKDKQLGDFSTKPGRFLLLTLADKTGEIRAVAWCNGEDLYSAFEDGDIVWIEGQVRTYKGNLQVNVNVLRRCERSLYDLADFLPRTKKDINTLLAKIREAAASSRDPFIWSLLFSFLEDDEWVELFTTAPAAKSVHHAYIGGLIEHTTNVLDICITMTRIYPIIDRDLLVAGAILHDIGKIWEYRYDGLIDITDEGRLIGHIVLGEMMLVDRIRTIEGFPVELAMRLRHMILSHHGEYEFGSPRRPKFIEACVLHYADNLDAQSARFAQITQSALAAGARWSAYDSILGRPIYVAPTTPEAAASKDTG